MWAGAVNATAGNSDRKIAIERNVMRDIGASYTALRTDQSVILGVRAYPKPQKAFVNLGG